MSKENAYILVINGPNLNMLGKREPEIYGTFSLNEVEAAIVTGFQEETFVFFQSNHEGAIIDKLNDALNDGCKGLIINAGAYTHYSYAIRDALAILTVPKVEVHLSNIYAREPFRHTSVISAVCHATIAGMGVEGYKAGIRFIQTFNL